MAGQVSVTVTVDRDQTTMPNHVGSKLPVPDTKIHIQAILLLITELVKV